MLGIKHVESARLALLLLVLSSKGTVYGRTKVQKMVYLANECFWGVIDDYRFYQYGPYSEWVTLQLSNLRDAGIIKENSQETETGRIVYKYSITEKGKSLLESILKEIGEDPLIERTKKLLDELSEYNSDKLEIMASLIMISKDDSLNREDVIKKVAHLKPRFDEKTIKEYEYVFDIIEKFKKDDN